MANTISVLMTRYSDLLSRLVYYLTGRGYTHVSISLGCGAPYYSFNFKGFYRETLEKPACLYLPQPLLRELIGQPNLVAVQENII